MAVSVGTFVNQTPSAALAAASRTPFELPFARAHYGDTAVDAFRLAVDNGFVPAWPANETATHPRCSDFMNLVDGLEPYADVIQALFLPTFSSVDGSDNCTALWSFTPKSIEMLPGANGGGVVQDDGGLIVNLGGGQGRGLTSPLDPSVMQAIEQCTLIWKGKMTARPAAPGYLARIHSGGSNVWAAFGPSSTKWRLTGSRRIAGTLHGNVTVDSSADTNTGVYERINAHFDVANGTMQLDVEDIEVIPETTWYDTNPGDWTSPANPTYLLQIGVPGASLTHNVQHAGLAVLTAFDPAAEAAVNAVLDAYMPS